LCGKAKVLQKIPQIEVVGAAIHDDSGRILCALRGEGMQHVGYWEFPGGKIEADEIPEAALIREIREEMGCLIAIEKLLTHTFDEQSTRRISLRIYLARLVEGEPQAREHEKILWLLPSELETLPWMPADREAVALLSGFRK
jgi:8-oxo-dGTP diphosphatase